MQFFDVTEKIIGCAYRVYNTMGSGYLEAVYEKCLAIELHRIGLSAEFQKPVDVYYEKINVGSYVVDILVDNKLIVELKAVRSLAAVHEVQLVNYLAASRIPLGLLINFGETKVEVKRKVLDLNCQV